ncbi:MAG: riboflavin synthase [Bacteroidia bacterium]|nr:riboflavin synthase [Bacteroidia bacterium]
MFTGIIETQAEVITLETEGTGYQITFTCPITTELHIDQSIAHDGICLTIIKIDIHTQQYQVIAVQETILKTTIKDWKAGTVVNIERCLRLGDRLDGHWVQGHVDTTGKVVRIQNNHASYEYVISFDPEHQLLIVPKGSICVNGISLTVVQANISSFSVAIIPYTYEHTNLKHLKPGDSVNLEFDIIGKYLLRFNGEVKKPFGLS